MTDKELLEHIVFLKKVVEDAPHSDTCPDTLYLPKAGEKVPTPNCNCWKSREMVTTPYSIPEKKKM